jgi:hypothetical protein
MKIFSCALLACALATACGTDCDVFENCQANSSYVESCTSTDSCRYVVHDTSGGSRSFNCSGACTSPSSLDDCTSGVINYFKSLCP